MSIFLMVCHRNCIYFEQITSASVCHVEWSTFLLENAAFEPAALMRFLLKENNIENGKTDR